MEEYCAFLEEKGKEEREENRRKERGGEGRGKYFDMKWQSCLELSEHFLKVSEF